MIHNDKLSRAKEIEKEDLPVMTRSTKDRIYIGQSEEFVGLSRHDAKRVLREIEEFLNSKGEE